MSFDRVLLLVLTGFLLLAGVGCLVAPTVFAEQVGYSTHPAALTEIRAFYGGLQIGVALFLVRCLRAPDRTALGLALGAVAVGCTGLARLVGLVLDDAPTSHHLVNLGIEAATVSLIAVALARSRRRPGRRAV